MYVVNIMFHFQFKVCNTWSWYGSYVDACCKLDSKLRKHFYVLNKSQLLLMLTSAPNVSMCRRFSRVSQPSHPPITKNSRSTVLCANNECVVKGSGHTGLPKHHHRVLTMTIFVQKLKRNRKCRLLDNTQIRRARMTFLKSCHWSSLIEKTHMLSIQMKMIQIKIVRWPQMYSLNVCECGLLWCIGTHGRGREAKSAQ